MSDKAATRSYWPERGWDVSDKSATRSYCRLERENAAILCRKQNVSDLSKIFQGNGAKAECDGPKREIAG